MRMTKEMYESLQVKDLKAIAESRGIATTVRMRKDKLVEKLLEADRKEDEEVLRQREEKARAAQAASKAKVQETAALPGAQGKDTGRPDASISGSDGAEIASAEEAAEKEPSGFSAQAVSDEAASREDTSPAASESQVPDAPSVHQAVSSADASQQSPADASPDAPAEGSREGARRPRQAGQPQKRTVRKRVEIAGNPRGRTAGSAGTSYGGRRTPTAQTAPAAQEQAAPRDTDPPEAVPYESADRVDVRQAEPSSMAMPAAENASGERTAGNRAASDRITADRYARRGLTRPDQQIVHKNEINPELDSGEIAHGIIEVLTDGYGFIRSNNYLPGENDVYVAPSQIRRFSLKTGDIVEGNIRIRSQNEKFSALLYVKSVNGMNPEETKKRYNFEDMTPIFPNERIRLERPNASIAMRVMDLMCPVGKGQRGMIVSPPKAGKTTLLKQVAKSIKANEPGIHLIILLIDERPEEVTDIREALEGPNVEVIHSTFDELPEHHKRVAEMTIERAKRLVEHKEDVVILLDSITRLTRAYNLTEPSSGRTLSGGLDPVALHMPKRFFGAARNMREGGSLTILATALIETGSKMDDVVYEEFKGTGNMEMILNRKLSERRIFPAVDLVKSGTRRDDLLLTPDEQECVATIRKTFIGSRGEEATDSVLELFTRTRSNGEFVNMVKKHMWSF